MWKYMVKTIGWYDDLTLRTSELNSLGRDGWEVAGLAAFGSDVTGEIYEGSGKISSTIGEILVILKRPQVD